MDQTTIDALLALVLGFAFAGLLASAFELLVRRPLSFGMLQVGGILAVASVPVLVFSAPMIIVRNLVRGPKGARPMPAVMVATMIACGWSLLCGRLVLDLTHLLVA